MESTPRRHGYVGPIILIILGVLFLLSTLGLLEWNIWQMITRLWPVLLVAAGIDFLLGRRPAWGLLIAAGVILLVAVPVAYWVGNPSHIGSGDMTNLPISQTLDGAKAGDIRINGSVGLLEIGALGAGSGNLLEGSLDLGPGEEYNPDFYVEGDTARLTVKSNGWRGSTIFRGENSRLWSMKLNADIPLDLQFNTGVGRTTLDLSGLKVETLKINSGVGRVDVSLPSVGRIVAVINGGVGEVNISLPRGMAARLQVQGGLGAVEVPDGYEHHDKIYYSPGYDQAENRIDLDIHGGIGKINLQENW